MPFISPKTLGKRSDCEQSFPQVLASAGLPAVDLRAWGGPVGRLQFGDATKPASEVQNGFRFEVSAKRLLTFQRRMELEFPNGEVWRPENGLTYTELHLDERPGVVDLDHGQYVFPFDLVLAPDVGMYFQPALAPEEIDEGCVRPEWCVGSFALYHRDGRKLGHIPRPWMKDARGDWLWGDFRRVGDTLAKVFDAAKVDALMPPFIVDDTFGYGSDPATATSIAGGSVIWSVKNTPASDGTITALEWYVPSAGNGATTSRELGLYDDTGTSNYPGAKLVTTAADTTAVTGAAWNSIAASLGVTAGSYYWFGLFSVNAGFANGCAYDTGVTNSTRYQTGQTYDTWPDPAVSTAQLARYYGVRSQYTPSGGGEDDGDFFGVM